MNLPEAITERKERWPITASVALLLANQKEYHPDAYKNLVLVRQRKNHSWGLVAGNLEKGETSGMTVSRELKEETGLDRTSLVVNNLDAPKLIEIPLETKTSIGLIFWAYMEKPIPLVGYEPDSPEIDFVKPFSLDEVKNLLDNRKAIFKPEFNQVLLNYWLWSYINWKYPEGWPFTKSIAQAWGLDERVFSF